MIFVPNGVFLIGLLSQLSLAGADKFSDGTAKYVEVDWVEANPLEDNIRENSIKINMNFEFEIFIIKGEENKCLYKVLRTSFPSTYGNFVPHNLAKASCALSLFTLSDVLNFNVIHDEEFIEYRTKGNTCRLLHRQANKPDAITNNDCSEVPTLSKSAVFGPVEHWNRFSDSPSYIRDIRDFDRYSTASIIWDQTYQFLLNKYEDMNKTQCWVKLNYIRHQFNPYRINQFFMDCEVNMLNLHRVVKQVRPDSLVFKFDDDKCFRTTIEVSPSRSSPSSYNFHLSNSTFTCDELLNPYDKDIKIDSSWWNRS